MDIDKLKEAASNYRQEFVDSNIRFEDIDYAEENYEAGRLEGVSISAEEAFIAGAKWALQNQWHDASNDLPYKNKTLVDGHTTRDLLCISDKNEAYIDFMELLKFGGKWHWFRKNIHKCKYWMPIPRRN